MTMGGRRTGLLKFTFVAPALVLLIALNVFPLLYNVVLSFSDAGLSESGWSLIGARNYSAVFGNPRFAEAFRTTALFVAAAVTAELVLGFGLALALRSSFRGRAVLLTIVLIPMMLSPAVMGLYWQVVLHGHYGVLNQILAAVGLGEPQWLTDPRLKLLSVLIIDVWMWTPFMMLISLAGLNSIPRHLYEAAEIDRAGAWRVFRRITLPMCGPLLVLAVLLRVTDALKQFDLVMAITGANDVSTQTLSALLYEVMFRERKVGLGSAYACVVLVVVIALAGVFIRYMGFIRGRQGKEAA